MKTGIIFFSVFLIQFFSFSQTRKKIDSINNISFEIKLEKASVLQNVFLKNVADAIKIKYKLGEGESYSNLALINYYQGNFENDLAFSLKAIAIYETIGAKDKLALEYGEMGYRMKKRNLSKALFYMRKAKLIAEKNKYQKPLLSIYNNYGVLKEMQTDYDSALYFYKKGLTIKEVIKDSIGIPYSLNNIAGIYVKQKFFDKAMVNYNKALDIRVLLNDQIGMAENYTYLGDLFLAQKQYKKSIFNYKIALNKSMKYKYLDLIQYNYEMLSKNYEAINNKDEALKNYKLFEIYKDSILNKETNSKIAELDIKYETAKKEKQLLEKEIEIKSTRNKLILASAIALFIGLLGLLIYRQQKLKNKQQEQEFELKSAILKIETQNKLQEQRLQISRDLHDNIGSQLTFIISSVDTIKYAFEIQNSKLDNKLSSISDFAKATIVELRDTIWAMNSNEITLEDLQTRIHNFIDKAKEAKETIKFSTDVEENLKNIKFTSIEGMNIYRTIQEAINNSIKYADAKNIKIIIHQETDFIVISILDDGKGFETEKIDLGNGINNMKKRISDIGGEIEIKKGTDIGTEIVIKLKK